MAASAPALLSAHREIPSIARENSGTAWMLLTGLTAAAVVIHGYHPYAEDGGLYLAGVKHVLDPSLYPRWTGFTTAHLRFSLFAPLVGGAVRGSHLGLMTVMFLMYVASIWLTLLAGWNLAVRCFPAVAARRAAITLLALLLTVPVAGTSLMLMDPYVSARSISTPCTLFALVGMIDIARQVRMRERPAYGAMILCLGNLFAAAVVHPLMAGYGLACVVVLCMTIMTGKINWPLCAGFFVLAMTMAAFIRALTPLSVPGYSVVAMTRTYWFIDAWHWYELCGLIAPLLVLFYLHLWPGRGGKDPAASLARMCIVAGTLAVLVACAFARTGSSSFAVARLQPLRIFQPIYVITILAVGAALGERILKRRIWLWAVLIASVGALMGFVQRASFPSSAHLEVPWTTPANGWEQAFLWARDNTPRNAVFALDANYISAPGEDAQNFRAIAERSALADYSKDGGVASIAPDLTPEWMQGETVQRDLDRGIDPPVLQRLRASGVNWVVLTRGTATELKCEYINYMAKVCRIR